MCPCSRRRRAAPPGPAGGAACDLRAPGRRPRQRQDVGTRATGGLRQLPLLAPEQNACRSGLEGVHWKCSGKMCFASETCQETWRARHVREIGAALAVHLLSLLAQPGQSAFSASAQSLSQHARSSMAAEYALSRFGLVGKTALVTGGTKGIGRWALVRRRRLGATVVASPWI